MNRARKPPSNNGRRRARAAAHLLPAREVDVVSQLLCAARHPAAAGLGALLGGTVPWFARELAHGELPTAWMNDSPALSAILLGVILGCCAFSMLTVYKFGHAAFGCRRKAIGFVLALEGVMLVSRGATSAWALGLLIVINAIANGCVIALARDATERRRADDARRSTTRAQNRTRTRVGTSQEAKKEHAAQPPQPPQAPMSRARVTTAATTPASAPELVRIPRPSWEDVSDAEIVREERWLS